MTFFLLVSAVLRLTPAYKITFAVLPTKRVRFLVSRFERDVRPVQGSNDLGKFGVLGPPFCFFPFQWILQVVIRKVREEEEKKEKSNLAECLEDLRCD